MNWELVFDVFKNSILITGLVIIMMLMIEYINIQSQGKWFKNLQGSPTKQVFLGAILGMVPGCIGGFAAVSLYTHRLISFGALIAMMIASSGDEAFVMLAMIPKDALILFAILFVIAIVAGLITNFFSKNKRVPEAHCEDDYELHLADHHNHHSDNGECDKSGECPHASLHNLLHPSWQRIVLLLGVAAFVVALGFGMLEHDHADHADQHSTEEIACVEHAGHNHATEHAVANVDQHAGHNHAAEHAHGFNILDEYWLNLIFAVLSLFVIYFIATAKEHFIKEHLWKHVICKHFLSIFCWTFGALLVIQIGLQYLDIEAWTKANIPFMILLAVLIGIIPESGPHMIFITLFAGGYIPFSVLLASSISQDGHSALPLLAEDKKGFLKSKLLNVAIGLIIGFGCYFIGF